MDGAEALTPESSALNALGRQGCPRCAEPWGRVPPAVTSILDGAALRRCTRCGSRYTADPPYRAVLSCSGCRLPFIREDPSESTCSDCRADPSFPEPPAPEIVAAAENEIRDSLGRCLKLVTSPALSAYLDRLARRVARECGNAPETVRVVLFEDCGFKTFSLPSGAIGMSVGMLSALEDEAELVFVLAHELAHVAAGDTEASLVRLGLHAVADDDEAPSSRAWTRAVSDLMALGHGLKRESRADRSALTALLALGYDPRSVLGFLTRVGAWVEGGDPRVSELAAAHPPLAERCRRVEEAARSVVTPEGSPRVNREVFRRAASQRRLAEELVPLAGFDAVVSPAAGHPARSARRAKMLWTGLGILLLAGLFLLVGILLAR